MDQPVFVTAIVRARGTRENPTGTIVIRSGRRIIARRGAANNRVVDRPGTRTLELQFSGDKLPVGTHRLKASFVGSRGFGNSASNPRRHQVTKAFTRVKLTTDAANLDQTRSEEFFRTPVQIIATVESFPLLEEAPRDGLVRYFSGSQNLGTMPVGRPMVIDSLAAEDHQLSATYLGSRNYHSSSSTSHPLLISFSRFRTVASDRLGSSVKDLAITPGTSNGLIFRRPSATPTVNRFGTPTIVAVAYERQVIANGPVDIEMQLWDFQTGFAEHDQTLTVSDGAIGVGFPDAAGLLDGNPRDGTIVVVWQAPGVQGLDIFARVYSRVATSFLSLTPEGPAFLVNSFTGGDQRRPRVSGTFDGGFVVVWQSPVIDGSGTVIFQRRFSPSGAPVDEESIVHPNLSGNQTLPDVAVLRTADFVVTWNDEGSRRIRGRQFLSNGNPRTEEFTLDATLLNQVGRGTRVAALVDSGYAIAWGRPEFDSLTSRASHFRRFVGAVTPIGGQETLSLVPNADEFDPDVASLFGGAFAAVWTGEDGPDSKGIGLRVYRPNGDATGLGEFANSGRLGDQMDATISPIPSGRSFVVMWTSEQPGTGSSNIFLRTFDLPIGGL